jgi:hypothetical protein
VRWKGDGAVHVLLIRRLYCENCRKIHHELPDCLVPYKRYEADVIESVIKGKTARGCGVRISTVHHFRKWWNAMKQYFFNVMDTLVAKFGVSYGSPPAFRETVRATTNSNNWTFPHWLSTRSDARPK